MSLFLGKFSLQWHRDMIHSVIHWHSKFAHRRIPMRGRWSGLTDMYDHLCPDTFLTTGTYSVKSYTLSVQSNKIKFRISKKKTCLYISVIFSYRVHRLEVSQLLCLMFWSIFQPITEHDEPFGGVALRSDCALWFLTLNSIGSSFTVLCDYCTISCELCWRRDRNNKVRLTIALCLPTSLLYCKQKEIFTFYGALQGCL